VDVTIENYSLIKPGTAGLRERLAWAQLNARLTPHWSATSTILLFPHSNTLDENFVKYTNGNTQVRGGRLRSAFGFSSWSDFYYNAIIAMPLVRTSRLNDYFGLSRFDTGADVRTIVGPVEVQAGLVDTNNGKWTLTPDHANYGVARVQTNVGPLIVGASALSRVVGAKTDDDTDAYGLDFRWTADHIQARAEIIRTFSDGDWAGGWYADCFYRPPGFYRTQLGVRVEGVALEKGVQQQYTAGLRQVLTPYLAATLNYAFGSGNSRPKSGWTLEISTSLHF